MSLGASEELRFYGNLIKNNLCGRKLDLYKIPGPPGYYLAGGAHLGLRDQAVANAAWAAAAFSSAPNLLLTLEQLASFIMPIIDSQHLTPPCMHLDSSCNDAAALLCQATSPTCCGTTTTFKRLSGPTSMGASAASAWVDSTSY